MIRLTDQYVWSVVFSIFFLLLVVMGSIILATEARIPWPELTLVDYALMTLATWRLTRLFVYDTITRFLREQFMNLKKVGRGYRLEAPTRGPRRVLHELFSCPWCTSVWLALVVVFLYQITAYAYLLIVLLALSAVAAFLQIIANWVGHNAEYAKKRHDAIE
jgi:hypothetical protein